jgi:serine/threonine protein kinase/tetratricopeptide (TPR) repeat protein
MTPERYQRIKQLFQEALEHDVVSRAAWLQKACGEDLSLCREVETLLRETTSAETLPFLETEAILAAAPNLPRFDQDRAMIGQRIGLYRIVGELGRGGMGNVYLAERDDEAFKRRVAIKIVRRGMDSDEILARFRHERQILATLDHPNIARLLDGGTTAEGLPYFVMEHIEGQPIDKYCESHQLKTPERLQLFRTVCGAVHYAHQNLVIHRDIKPTNILVTEDGTVKLLDFGIAKILNPEMSADTIYPTRTWERPMTPAYASPEQVVGHNVTTATDVYSLGVVLYELLTGQKPYEIKSVSPHEIARIVCENEPDRPSTAVVRRTTADGARETNSKYSIEYAEKLRRQLQGDLDNIVLMALRKEPERRYASVQQFSEDVRRHLAGRPVVAREDTVGYRLSKFIARHRAGVIAATLITLSLLAGLVTTIWQTRVARQQRAIAERRFNDVRKLANNVMFKYHDAIENLPGATPVREMLVKDALEYLDNLSRESGNDPALQQELAAAYEKVGLVQGHPFYSNLGDRAGAMRSYEKALAIRRSLAAAGLSDAKSLYDLSRSQTLLADLKSEGGDVAGAINGYREALPICERALAAAPNDTSIRNWVGVIYERLAEMLEKIGDYKTSLDYTYKSLAFAEQIAAAEPSDQKWQRNLAISYIKLGDRMYTMLDYVKALEFYRQALERYETLFAADKLNAPVRRELATTLDSAGKMLQLLRRFDDAMAMHRRALELREAGIAADPKNELLRGDLTVTTELIGETLAKKGDTAGALEWHRKTLALREAVFAADPAFTDANRYIAISHTQIGDALLARNDSAAATEHFRKAQKLLESLSASDQANLDVSRALAGCYSRFGKLHAMTAAKMKARQAEHWQEARSWFQRSLTIWNSKMPGSALSPVDAQEKQQTMDELAKCDAALSKLKGG